MDIIISINKKHNIRNGIFAHTPIYLWGTTCLFVLSSNFTRILVGVISCFYIKNHKKLLLLICCWMKKRCTFVFF